MDVMLETILDLMGPKKGSGKELADYLGVSGNVITNWKNGSSKSYYRYGKQIAKFYGVSLEYLTTGEEPQKQKTPARKKPVSDAEIKFALFGDIPVDDADLEDVKRFAAFIAQKKKGGTP